MAECQFSVTAQWLHGEGFRGVKITTDRTKLTLLNPFFYYLSSGPSAYWMGGIQSPAAGDK